MSERIICWQPVWNRAHPGIGLEHLVVSEGMAESVILGMREDGTPFRVDYHLAWDAQWRLRRARIARRIGDGEQALELTSDGAGSWRDAEGAMLPHLAGCIDIDIWPTPFTNTFPIRRAPPAAINDRADYRMAWVDAVSGPAITVKPLRQGYTRLEALLYRYENLDGSGFSALLPVDGEGLVVDYEGLFRRVPVSAR